MIISKWRKKHLNKRFKNKKNIKIPKNIWELCDPLPVVVPGNIYLIWLRAHKKWELSEQPPGGSSWKHISDRAENSQSFYTKQEIS